MRQDTLQEQYNRIVEGKGNKTAFHKQALRQFPHLFTAQSSFDQVVTVFDHTPTQLGCVFQNLIVSKGHKKWWDSQHQPTVQQGPAHVSRLRCELRYLWLLCLSQSLRAFD